MNEAPQFYLLFTSIMALSVIIILLPNAPLITITIWTQVINAMLLPVVLISMITLTNKKNIMGVYTNKNFQNVIGWTTVVLLILLTAMLFLAPILKVFKGLIR